MSPIRLLEDALAEGRAFTGLAGRLRDTFKSGAADLQALCDEAEGVVDGVLAKARDGLAAFKSEVSRAEDEAKDAAASLPGPAASAPTVTTSPSGATVTVDPAAGSTTHVDPVAAITTTLDHVSGAATAVDAASGSVEPSAAVMAEARQAAAAAGVVVPE